MQLSSVNPIGCQPLKNSVSAVPLRNNSISFKNSDSFQRSDSKETLEAKYDFACRLAAYYQKAYNDLAQKKSCNA